MKMKLILPVLLAISFSVLTQAQNSTLWLLNGKQVPVSNYQLKVDRDNDTLIYFTKLNGKLKKQRIENLFSVINSDSSETVFYKYNLENGNYFYENQMRNFLMGEYKMKQTYRAPMFAIAGFGSGLAGTLIPSAKWETNSGVIEVPYGIIIPATYSILSSYSTMPSEKLLSKYPELNTDEFYLMGCQEGIRKIRMRNSLIGVGIGILSGIIILTAAH